MRTCASIVIALVSLLVAACGGGETTEPSAATTPESSRTAPERASATDTAIASAATTTSGTSPWAAPTATAPAPPVPTVDPIAMPGPSGNAANGASIFASKCASCHGAEARGDTAMGRKYGIKDFRSADVRALTTADLARIMKLGNGKLSEGAHPKANLTDQDVRDMVAFIQAMK